MVIQRFEIWWVNLDPTVGSEVKKIRPCLIVSPNEVNQYLNTVTVIPLTSTIKLYPTRLNCIIQGKQSQLVIDQVRSIDKLSLKSKMLDLPNEYQQPIVSMILEYFKF
jgi:mRNA interferase MazF